MATKSRIAGGDPGARELLVTPGTLYPVGRELIAWLVASTLAVVVIGVGLRRNLSETTRRWLPRFGARPTARLGLYEGEERRRHPLSARETRRLAYAYLVLGVFNMALAVLGGDLELLYAAFGAGWVLIAVRFLKKSARPSGRPPSWSD